MRINRRQMAKSTTAFGAAATLLSCAKTSDSAVDGAPSDLGDFDAVETAFRIRNGDITALEAVDSAIARLQKAEPAINGVVAETLDAARDAAKTGPNGPLAGVPTFVKDLADVAGQPTGFGSRAYDGHVAMAQSPFIDDFQGAGLISLGKSATPEFGLTATTEPVSNGPSRNPWNTDHSTGGSSGGAGALVAAGVTPIAHASDGGGSIRIPASCCGLVGLKVSRDRYRPVRDESQTPVRLSVQGVESRTVRDTAAFLAAMEAPDETLAAAGLSRIGLVEGPSKRRLKIGYFTKSVTGAPVDADVVDAIEQTAATCAELRHEVSPLDKSWDASLADPFLLYWAGIANTVISDWERASGREATEAEFEPFTFGLRDHYRSHEDKVGAAVLALIAFGRAYEAAFSNVDVILSPVTTAPSPAIGYFGDGANYEESIARVSAYAQYTSPANIAGAASLSLPLGMSKGGLPIGSLFNGRKGDERMLLELAFELEEAAPWRDRKPQVWVA